MSIELKRSQRGQTMVLTLCNPEMRNALGPEIYAAGMTALNDASADPLIRSVVIVGEGTVFCAGGNLQRLLANREKPPEAQYQSIDELHIWIQAIRACPKPIIAAVEGAAAGAGFSLALACDMVVAARDAVFVMAYSNIALSPDGGGSWSLSQALPRQLVTEVLMCGERIPATRLHVLGLVNRISEPGTALADALQLAQQLNERAPNAIASAKTLVSQAEQALMQSHLDLEREHFVRNLHQANAAEGIIAFLEKRSAKYV